MIYGYTHQPNNINKDYAEPGNLDEYLTNRLCLFIILVLFYKKEEGATVTLSLKDFTLDGNTWSYENFTEYVTNEDGGISIGTQILLQIEAVLVDLSLSKRMSVYVDDNFDVYHILSEKLIKINHAGAIAGALYDYGNLSKLSYIKNLEETKKLQSIKDSAKSAKAIQDKTNRDKVYVSKREYENCLGTISEIAPECVHIEVEFNLAKFRKLENELNNFRLNYGNKVYKNNTSAYEKEVYNFKKYLNNLEKIKDEVQIPLTTLHSDKFNIIFMLFSFQQAGKILVHNYGENDAWIVSILPSYYEESTHNQKGVNKEIQKLKFKLSFDVDSTVMTLTNDKGDKHTIKVQGRAQKDVLRVIFEDSDMAYSQWSLYDIADKIDDTTPEKTVKNAIYQFNKKVKIQIPEIKSLFGLTSDFVKINQKYIEKT